MNTKTLLQKLSSEELISKFEILLNGRATFIELGTIGDSVKYGYHSIKNEILERLESADKLNKINSYE